MTGAFDVEAIAKKAMVRPLSATLRSPGAASIQLPTRAEMDADLDGYARYSIHDEPYIDDLLAEGEWQAAVADRLYDEPGDRTLDDEMPAGYSPTWWRQSL